MGSSLVVAPWLASLGLSQYGSCSFSISMSYVLSCAWGEVIKLNILTVPNKIYYNLPHAFSLTL